MGSCTKIPITQAPFCRLFWPVDKKFKPRGESKNDADARTAYFDYNTDNRFSCARVFFALERARPLQTHHTHTHSPPPPSGFRGQKIGRPNLSFHHRPPVIQRKFQTINAMHAPPPPPSSRVKKSGRGQRYEKYTIQNSQFFFCRPLFHLSQR